MADTGAYVPMSGQLVRKIHRWRFEIPLALVLGGAAGFAASVMPTDLFVDVPLLGKFGLVGQGALALALGLVFGWSGYAVMRRPVATAAEADAEAEEDSAEEEATDRLRRFRRADFHPDAPPRAPIRAHRDLGEPFMEVGASGWGASEEDADSAMADPAIPDGDFIDVSGEPFVEPAVEVAVVDEAVVSNAVEAAFVDVTDVAEQVVATPGPIAVTPSSMATFRSAPRAERQSLNEMMERLSAGLERRVRDAARGAPPLPPRQPPRDMSPALRDALDELNRLAARRD